MRQNIEEVDTTGKDTKRIKEYIENQLREDMMSEQLTLDVVDPFTGNQEVVSEWRIDIRFSYL